MPFELVVAEGNGRERRFRFEAAEVTIGRAPENDLVVHDPGASRGHARIRAAQGDYTLVDDASCNGTRLNEQEMRGPVRLRSGDRIRVGSTMLEFTLRREANALRTALRRRPPRTRAAVLFGAAAFAACLACAITAMTTGGGAALPPARAADRDGGTAAAAPVVPLAAELFPEALRELREIRESYERGRRKLEERRIAPRNLYDAWRAFSATATAVTTVAPAEGIPSQLSELVQWTQRELDTDCKRLLFGAARSERYGQEAQARATYREILLRFPGDDPSGCRRKAQEALGAIETAAPGGGVFGYPEER